MGLFDLIRTWFGGGSERPRSADDRLEWLEADETRFGVRVLDCRPFAESVTSMSTDPVCIQFFLSREALSGEQFRDQHPEEALRLACDLRYPLQAPLSAGPVFVSTVMEDKWNIYYIGDAMYLVRSWTGRLAYRAHVANAATELHIDEIEALPENVLGPDEMAVRQVDFIIRSHLFNQAWPHPVPGFKTANAIAHWSFSQYGRRGMFAAPVPYQPQ